jgi:hypothetical protein
MHETVGSIRDWLVNAKTVGGPQAVFDQLAERQLAGVSSPIKVYLLDREGD